MCFLVTLLENPLISQEALSEWGESATVASADALIAKTQTDEPMVEASSVRNWVQSEDSDVFVIN